MIRKTRALLGLNDMSSITVGDRVRHQNARDSFGERTDKEVNESAATVWLSGRIGKSIGIRRKSRSIAVT